ncbi:MAG: hypothetical protein JSV52_09445 [Candidatus Zixiibacteriota bacterium]|nr:MAG: hypothetical protein JSV52_09445 [candidate division Zixibacteria bacterium]
MLKQQILMTLMVLTALMMPWSASAQPSERLTLSLPDLDWALQIDVPDFKIKSGGLRPDGLATKAVAVNDATGIVLSVFIEVAQKPGDSRVAREYYLSGIEQSPMKEEQMVTSEDGDVALLEYVIKEYQGVKVNQRNVNAYMVRDEFWVDVHLSKAEYVDSEKKLFDELLASVVIVDDYIQTEMDNLIYASSFYMERNLEKAAVYYEKAIEKDLASTTLPLELWRVAVDNLGMAYGMSGDLENSKRVLLKGIRQDPDYPMFYYNLACTCAELNDEDAAMSNLRKAYERKGNMIKGEQFPDPRSDSSFEKYVSDPDFLALLAEFED